MTEGAKGTAGHEDTAAGGGIGPGLEEARAAARHLREFLEEAAATAATGPPDEEEARVAVGELEAELAHGRPRRHAVVSTVHRIRDALKAAGQLDSARAPLGASLDILDRWLD
jgi:flavin-dependent dehydrogenase